MVDPDGTLDALASLGLTAPPSPPKPQTSKTSPPSATPPPAKGLVMELLPAPGGSSARVKSLSANKEQTARGCPAVGGASEGVGVGLTYSRLRPNGEEAVARK